MLLNITLSLSAMGLTWKAILPLAGALGIGLGFGLQTILNNYVSGFILMFSRNIRVGDFVELPGNAGQFINNPSNYIFGRVEDISILTTRIRTLDGIDILVPNSTFIGNQIINYSLKNPFVRVRFPFGVAYSSDPDKVKEILIKLAYDCPWAKNYYRPPQVWFTALGDSALLFELLMWVDIRELWKNPYKTLSYSLVDWVYTNGFKRLKEANIEIPFPQQDIWFRNNLKVVIENEEGKPLGVLKKENRTKDV
jgi:small-conductance mechanosensitive channel